MFPSLIRAVTVGAVVTGCLLALLGLATTSGAVLITMAVTVILIGPAVAMAVHSTLPDSGLALRVGAAGSAATLAAGLIVAGLVVLLGAVAVPVVLTLLASGGIWLYRHGSSWLDRIGCASTGRRTMRICLPSRARGTVVAAPHSGQPTAPVVPLGLPGLDIGTASMPGLCAAWQRTYWLLRDLPLSSPASLGVVQLRAELLEEFERRDPAGLRRWLHTEPRACRNPGRYLTAGH
jgi:hypothetical protein